MKIEILASHGNGIKILIKFVASHKIRIQFLASQTARKQQKPQSIFHFIDGLCLTDADLAQQLGALVCTIGGFRHQVGPRHSGIALPKVSSGEIKARLLNI